MHESDKHYATVIVQKGTRRNIHFIMKTLLIFKKVLSKNQTVEIGLKEMNMWVCLSELWRHGRAPLFKLDRIQFYVPTCNLHLRDVAKPNVGANAEYPRTRSKGCQNVWLHMRNDVFWLPCLLKTAYNSPMELIYVVDTRQKDERCCVLLYMGSIWL